MLLDLHQVIWWDPSETLGYRDIILGRDTALNGLANTSAYEVKILSASCFLAGVPGKSAKVISVGRSCSLWGVAGKAGSGNSWPSAPRGHDMITLLH